MKNVGNVKEFPAHIDLMVDGIVVNAQTDSQLKIGKKQKIRYQS